MSDLEINHDATEADESAPTLPVDAVVEAEADASVFYNAREDLDVLSACPIEVAEPALKRLGQPAFVRKGFPFLGLLATIYDHVAQRVDNEARSHFRVTASEDEDAPSKDG